MHLLEFESKLLTWKERVQPDNTSGAFKVSLRTESHRQIRGTAKPFGLFTAQIANLWISKSLN